MPAADREPGAFDQWSGAARADDAAAAAPGELKPHDNLRDRQEQLLDEGIQETYPASDPVAVVNLRKTIDSGLTGA